MRTFESGATRDTDDGKYDYEAFLSPVVLECFASYMHEHRIQPDGSLRDGDNWQKGMPVEAYMKSLLRHVMDAWLIHRGHSADRPEDGSHVEWLEALCAILFNVQGLLHAELTGGVPTPRVRFTTVSPSYVTLPADLKRVDL